MYNPHLHHHIMTGPTTATLIAMLATATGGLIEDHSIDIKTVSSVGGIVFAGVWAISRRFTRIEDRLDEHERLMRGLRCVRDREEPECEQKKKKK